MLPIHDDPVLAAERAELQAAHLAAKELERITGKTAEQRVMEAIAGKAVRVRHTLIKNAARRYRDRPQLLDAIRLGLSDAHPTFILSAVERALPPPWGRIDMLGVIPINLAGAALYARWLRRLMNKPKKELAHG